MFKHATSILAASLGLMLAAAAQGVNPATVNPPTAGSNGNPPVATNAPPVTATPPSLFGGNWEIFAGGFMQFAKATTANSVPLSTTNVAGPQLDLGLHVNDTTMIEIRDAMSWPVQSYGNSFQVRARLNDFAFEYVWIPTAGSVHPFLEGGFDWLHYTPSGGNNTPGAISQNKYGADYGGGLDFALTKSLTLRLEYRGLIYRVPDFGLIVISKWNHMPEPDAGLVWHF